MHFVFFLLVLFAIACVLYGLSAGVQVCIACTVRDEILPNAADFPDFELLTRALAEEWIEVVDIPLGDWKPLNPGVYPGEASAILLPATGEMRAMLCCW